MPYSIMHCTALRWIIGLLIVMSGLLPATGHAQALSAPNLLGSGSAAARWHVEPLPTPARPGEHLTVHFAASIDAGGSMYALGLPVGQPLPIGIKALLCRQAADARTVVPLPGGDRRGA